MVCCLTRSGPFAPAAAPAPPALQDAAIRQEVVNREIKTNLTQILLEVTDALFGETVYVCLCVCVCTCLERKALSRSTPSSSPSDAAGMALSLSCCLSRRLDRPPVLHPACIAEEVAREVYAETAPAKKSAAEGAVKLQAGAALVAGGDDDDGEGGGAGLLGLGYGSDEEEDKDQDGEAGGKEPAAGDASGKAGDGVTGAAATAAAGGNNGGAAGTGDGGSGAGRRVETSEALAGSRRDVTGAVGADSRVQPQVRACVRVRLGRGPRLGGRAGRVGGCPVHTRHSTAGLRWPDRILVHTAIHIFGIARHIVCVTSC
mgnify:CR=1 FL=1